MKLLTKSRFKLGLECPNKLYYTRKKEYANKKQEDPFLQALAQGEFDPIIPVSAMRDNLIKTKTNLPFLTIKNVGHMSIWEDPVQLVEVMKGIVKID